MYTSAPISLWQLALESTKADIKTAIPLKAQLWQGSIPGLRFYNGNKDVRQNKCFV